jgi:hypothetical protein
MALGGIAAAEGLVIGALCISVLLSLVAAPAVYFLMLRLREKETFRKLAQKE